MFIFKCALLCLVFTQVPWALKQEFQFTSIKKCFILDGYPHPVPRICDKMKKISQECETPNLVGAANTGPSTLFAQATSERGHRGPK